MFCTWHMPCFNYKEERKKQHSPYPLSKKWCTLLPNKLSTYPKIGAFFTTRFSRLRKWWKTCLCTHMFHNRVCFIIERCCFYLFVHKTARSAANYLYYSKFIVETYHAFCRLTTGGTNYNEKKNCPHTKTTIQKSLYNTQMYITPMNLHRSWNITTLHYLKRKN